MIKNFQLISLSLLFIIFSSSALLAIDEKFPGPEDFVAVEQAAEMIYEEPPVYPDSARIKGEEATVYLKALIDKTGKVRKSMAIKSNSDNEAFEKAAIEAASKNRFKPAIQNGQPVAVWVTYKVEFELDDDSYPPPDKFIKVEKAAEMIYQAEPKFPSKAQKAGIEGIVWVKALVNKKGQVKKASIHKVSMPDFGFEEAALDAAYQNRFKPAVQDGKPVAIWVTYSVKFALDEKN